MSIIDKIQVVKTEFESDIKSSSLNQDDLISIKSKYLGRKGLVSKLFNLLGNASKEERPVIGGRLNTLKNYISEKLDKFNFNSDLVVKDRLDYTLPGDPSYSGSIHPLTQITEEIKKIFIRIGFSLAYGPEVESDFYNFEALNIPKHHPARDMQDTFYTSNKYLLRTHTSATQIHFMEENEPPIRIIAPGRVYRNEDISVRSYCLFHQIEGLYIDNNVKFSELKGTLDYFARALFGKNVKTRFRPSYFPFTEPSAEMDVSCIFCKCEGCSICKKTGWLEILGCGMVDPEVYKSVNYDYKKWSGYAFGLGIERIAMLLYGIDDIRKFYEGDIKFLKQF